MTEPPRPPGAGAPGPQWDPTAPPASYSTPGEAPPPGYAPPPAAPQYESPGAPPPGSGGYPPPGGYPPQGGTYYGAGGVPAGYATNEDKNWALIAHFGGAAGMLIGAGCAGWIAPLIALVARGNQSPTVRAHAVAALNFQLLWSIVGVVGWILTCIVIGFFGVLAAMGLGIIFGIVAGLKANEGQLYRYPMSVSIIK